MKKPGRGRAPIKDQGISGVDRGGASVKSRKAAGAHSAMDTKNRQSAPEKNRPKSKARIGGNAMASRQVKGVKSKG